MTALTADRNTPRRVGTQYNDPVAASTEIFAGSIVVLDASGNAEPGSAATGKTARGVAQAHVNNTGAAGAKTIDTEPGIFRFANDGSVARAHIGGTAYIVDDQTVADNDDTGSRSAAGTIMDVDSDGVWVKIG
jgi:hypothetical protein